ncbi:Translational activator of cytochrome c oxidase 1 [Nymphon striatum]|nr:Translational activator of cytochrome c oxidase 1 [Nymphon striatum]
MSLRIAPQRILSGTLRYNSQKIDTSSMSPEVPRFLFSKVIGGFNIYSRGMAGHSKWQNIKQTKTAKDQERSTIFSKLSLNIRMAITGGQTNPSLNPALANAIAQAKKANMPLSKIENILKSDEKTFQKGLLEIKGPRGCFVIVELYSDGMRRTESFIRAVVKKIEGFAVVDNARSLNSMFEQKGVIQTEAAGPDGKPISIDKATDDAIISGAEEVEELQDEEKNIYQFTCDPFQLFNVRKNLEETGTYVINSAENIYVPLTAVALNESETEQYEKLCVKLNTFTETVNIYNNLA